MDLAASLYPAGVVTLLSSESAASPRTAPLPELFTMTSPDNTTESRSIWMLFVARRTAFPTPAETCVWARRNGVQKSATNRNRERCLIAMNLRVVGSGRFDCRDLGPALTTYSRIPSPPSPPSWHV